MKASLNNIGSCILTLHKWGHALFFSCDLLLFQLKRFFKMIVKTVGKYKPIDILQKDTKITSLKI